MKMEKKVELPTSSPPSVGDYEDSQSTYTVDQPPPAYHKPELPAIKVAKIVAGTILIVTLIAGLTAVAIVYMQHNLKCAQLVADQESTTSELPQAAKVIQDQQEINSASFVSASEERPTRLPYPIRVDFDEITGKMMETNKKARLSCVIEKKRSESSKTSGNTTANGETMTLSCRSANDRASSSRPKSSTGKSSSGRSSTTTTTTTTEKSASGPILIRIPLSRGPLFRPQLRLIGQSGPASPSILRNPENPLDAFIQQMTATVTGPALRPQSSPALNPIQLLLQGLHTLLPIPVPKEQDQSESKQDNDGPHNLRLRPNGHGPFPPMMPQQSQEMPALHRMFNPMQQLRIPMMPFPGGPGPFPNVDDMLPRLLDVQKRIQHERRLEEEMEQQQEQRRREQAGRRQEQEKEARRQQVGDSSDADDSDEEDDDDSPAVVTIHELRRPDGNGPVPAAESRSLRGRPEGRALPMREMHPFQRIPMPMPPMFNNHQQIAPPAMMGAHVRSEPVFLHPQNPPKEMQQHPREQHQQHNQQQQQEQNHPLQQQHPIQQQERHPNQQQEQHPLQQQQHPLQQQEQHPLQPQIHQDQQQRLPNHPLSQEEMAEIHARQHQEGNNQHPNAGQMEGSPSFHEMAHLVPPPPHGDMLMERNGPLPPFITGSHNMQPRSSARPRVERSAESCSCVCK